MDDVVIVALISLLGTLFGTFAGILKANKLAVYRIGELEKKMDKYNNVLERVALLEQDNTTQWKRIDEIRDEIDDIRKEMNL